MTIFNRPTYDGKSDSEALAALDEASARGKMFPSGFRRKMEEGLARCESPMEMALFPWLVCQEYWLNDRFVAEICNDGNLPAWMCSSRQTVVCPQYWIPGLEFRVDFAIASRGFAKTGIVVVEVDGYAFHRTEEQIKKDKLREKLIRAHPSVIGFIRLPGAIVNANPRAAAKLAANYHEKVWKRPPPIEPEPEPPATTGLPIQYVPPGPRDR